jgi:hypothetical protein
VHEIPRAEESKSSLQQVSVVRLLRNRSQPCRQSLAHDFAIFGCEASSPVPLSRKLRSGLLRYDTVRCRLRSALRLRCWVPRGDNKVYVAYLP